MTQPQQQPQQTDAPPAVTPPVEPAPRPPITINAPQHHPDALSNVGATLAQMGQTLAALPEQLVNAVREGTATTTPPAQPETQQPATQQPAVPTVTPAGKTRGPNRFAKRWFGLD